MATSSTIELQYGDCQRYKRHELETLLKETAFAKLAAQVERERCEADLLYCLLMKPSEELLNRVLRQCHEMVLKKNAPDMDNSRIIRESWDVLMRAGNTHVKLFRFLFMLNHEPEIQEMMRHGYILNHPGNLWGERAHSHLADFLLSLEKMVKDTLNWPCSDANILDVVHNMVNGARLAYMTL